MIIALTYFLVAHGCSEAGLPFWRSLTWPVALGHIIARTALTEGGE